MSRSKESGLIATESESFPECWKVFYEWKDGYLDGSTLWRISSGFEEMALIPKC